MDATWLWRGGPYGHKKINLIHGGDETEGIWYVPVTTSDDQKMRVYLSNMPLGWGGRCWGAEVIATTRGASRPNALPEDQSALDDDTKKLWQGLRQLQALAKTDC